MQEKRNRSTTNLNPRRYLSPPACVFLLLLLCYLVLSARLLKTPRRSTGHVSLDEVDGAVSRSQTTSRPQIPSAGLCPHAEWIGSINYTSERSGRRFEYQLSLHDTAQDLVVSRLLLEGNGRYGTVSEVHAVCERGQEGGYGIECEAGKTFVEVGSALGHVSMYMAARGMSVVAIDPLEANIERFKESMCINGAASCLSRSPPSSAEAANIKRCSKSSEWLSYSPGNVVPIVALVSNVANDTLTLVESEPYNLAATIKGRGNASSLVKTMTIDGLLPLRDIELLYLTCQGCEALAIEGAKTLISSRRVRNIIWRLHSYNQVLLAHQNSMKIAEYLLLEGYVFYHMEATRQNHTSIPRVIPNASVIDYVTSPREDHPEILASLSPSMEALGASKVEALPEWLFPNHLYIHEVWDGDDLGYGYGHMDMDMPFTLGNDSTWAALDDNQGDDSRELLPQQLSNTSNVSVDDDGRL